MQDANPSDWINGDLFLEYLKHFIRHTRCSKEKKVLLILNIHESHISLAVIDLAKENRLLTMPLHTSHKLQSLDACCMSGLKTLPSDSRRGLHQELASKASRHTSGNKESCAQSAEVDEVWRLLSQFQVQHSTYITFQMATFTMVMSLHGK